MPPPSSDSRLLPPSSLSAVAAQGFASGALRFGSISLITHIILNPLHPVYRNLTIQFKVFIQLSAMTLGGCIFAEKRVTEFNDSVRRINRARGRSERAWREEEEIKERVRAEMEREGQVKTVVGGVKGKGG